MNEAALDQPRINAAITLPGSPSDPLVAEAEDIFGQPYETFTIQAFFDTGASGVLMSKETADALGVPLAAGVEFGDVGVGGTSFFNVSDDVLVHLAPYTPTADLDNPATFTSVYDQSFGPLRMQVAQTNADFLTGPLDVFGMPLFQGKTVVMDARPVSQGLFGGTIDTTVHDSGDPTVDFPPAHLTIPTTAADFSRFTTVTPSGAQGPTLNDNPFIGPDPTISAGGASATNGTPGVQTFDDGQTHEGSWLFDTGAATTIVSSATAAAHHVRYVAGTEETETPQLERFDPNNPEAPGTAIEETFTIQVGGVGGVATKAGFFLESLTLPTVEGEPITFTNAPVLVADIEVQDPVTLEAITLDGILGMNYFVATTTLNPLFGEISAGAFDFFTFDQPTGNIGLTINQALLDTPAFLNSIATGWKQSASGWDEGDLNGDGFIDEFDLARLAVMWPDGEAAFAEAVAATTFVPEPGTAGLLAGVGLMVLGYRPRRRAAQAA